MTTAAVIPLRPELPDVPALMKDLPVDERGYPVPWFVDWVDGKPEFRAMDRYKFRKAIEQKLCWVCGKPLWPSMVFVIGPMCAINRVSSEPPSHWQCARFSATACPFLSRPHMKRREDETFNNHKKNAAGVMVERNPGATLLWYTRRYELINSPRIEGLSGAGILFSLGRAEKVEWFCEGRPATRAEVLKSIEMGLPLLHEANAIQNAGFPERLDEGRLRIEAHTAQAMKLLPKV